MLKVDTYLISLLHMIGFGLESKVQLVRPDVKDSMKNYSVYDSSSFYKSNEIYTAHMLSVCLHYVDV